MEFMNIQWRDSNPHLLCGDVLPLKLQSNASPMNPQLQTREEMAIAILIQDFDSPYCVLVQQI